MKINSCIYHLKGKDDFITKRHIHNDIEIIHIVKGNGTVIKNNLSYPMKDGYIFFIDARKPHIVYPDNYHEYTRNKLVIDADLFFEFCMKLGIIKNVKKLFDGPPVKEKNGKFNSLFKIIFELSNNGDDESEGFATAYILEIIHFAASNINIEDNYNTDGIMQKIFTLISEANGCISLEELSETLSYNKFYLCHLFRQKTGLTISKYSEDKKYETALRLLSESEISISDISERCGFSNPSSFTRFFKLKSGISPMEFRKSKRSMP